MEANPCIPAGFVMFVGVCTPGGREVGEVVAVVTAGSCDNSLFVIDESPKSEKRPLSLNSKVPI